MEGVVNAEASPLLTDAIVRPPGPSFGDGLTTAGLGAPDIALALRQHRAYCDALILAGVAVHELGAAANFPDSTFVEDTAVLTPRVAVLTRPGAPSREEEVPLIADALGGRFPDYDAIVAPGTLDGGDICQVGEHFLIGLSARTNTNGAEQFGSILEEHGYTGAVVDIRGRADLLHLKSGVSWIGGDVLVVGRSLAGHAALAAFSQLVVPDAESYAANCIRVNSRVLIPAGHPEMENLVRSAGLSSLKIDVSEFRKMDGGLSCLSLRY